MGHLGIPRAFGTGGVPHFAADGILAGGGGPVDGLGLQADALEM
jgi:hypothetical protein